MPRTTKLGWRQLAMAAMVAATLIGPMLFIAYETRDVGGGDERSEYWAMVGNSEGDDHPQSLELPNGMRALTIKVDSAALETGLVQPNSVVDLRSTTLGDEKEAITQTILQNARVLAVNKVDKNDPEKTATVSDNITIAVTREQAELLSLAQKTGELRLGLRAPDDLEKATIRTLKPEDIRLGRVAGKGEQAAQPLHTPLETGIAAPDLPTARAYPAADLTVPIPNAINTERRITEDGRSLGRPALSKVPTSGGTASSAGIGQGWKNQGQRGGFGGFGGGGFGGGGLGGFGGGGFGAQSGFGKFPPSQGAFPNDAAPTEGSRPIAGNNLPGLRTRVTTEPLSSLGGVMIGSNNPQDAEAALEIIKKMQTNGTAPVRRQAVGQPVTKIVGGKPVTYTVTKSVPARGESEQNQSRDRHPVPQKDSKGGVGNGPGTVDSNKLKELAKNWGELGAKERESLLLMLADFNSRLDSGGENLQKARKAEVLSELDREIEKKKEILSRSAASGEQVEELKKLKKLREEINTIESKPAQVWKQNRGRPTFARVHLGDGNSLELVSLHVTTTIDGPRARTMVDHVFRNPHERQLEGTFEYPLPTGASPSYYAMFPGKTRTEAPPLFAKRGPAKPLDGELLASLKPNELARAVSTDDWGNLMESRVVSQQKALEVYEDVTRARIDPALLEYAGGNTFSGRVFPIPPKGFSRVIMAYEELLSFMGDKDVYRFALPDCKLNDIAFTLQADASLVGRIFNPSTDAAEGMDWKSALRQRGDKGVYEKHWTNDSPGGEVRFTFSPPEPRIHVASGRQNDGGPLYVYARVRPDLKVQKSASSPENAVFLLDTSLSEHPDRFAVNMLLIKKILESDDEIRQFNILAFNVGAAWVDTNGWIRNTKAGRERAFNTLDGIILEGATDFSAALDKLSITPFIVSRSQQPLNVFLLSDGQITWGESDVNALVSRFESRCPKCRFHCYRTGLSADNLELFTALTRRGGGVFHCYSEADLPATAVAHRNHCFTVDSVHFVGGPSVSDVLIAGRQAAVFPGGELLLAGRASETGKTTLVVEGTYLGKRLVHEYPVEITGTGELAPRGWGEIAVASLLSLNDAKHDDLVTAYCQQFGIGSRTASFLILENEKEYKRFNLDEERNKTLTGDLGQWLENKWEGFGKVLSARASFRHFLERIEERVKLMSGAQGEHVKKLLALMSDADYELPAASINGKLLRETDVPMEYLVMRETDPQNVHTYLEEARRRAAKQDVDGAVRVLSSVIEEHPGRGDALRLVGYRLLDMQQPVHASRLFERVERSRPFEPHSYRDLARSLEACGKFGLAAIHYEIILAGTWHARFHASLKEVALEEYAAMMRDALRRRAVTGKLADQFGERLEKLDTSKAQSDLRVTISWNTDNTDVDLWVIEPDGEKCFYSHNKTKSGGELSQDMTQGYGPERYQIKKAQKGTYRVIVNYFNMNPNLLAGETHVNVTVTRSAGTPQETTERHTVILRQSKEEVEVCKVEF
jgi:hypothetical protein